MTRVAVIGAGWAGLTAAVELAASGCRVELFEAARQAGGRARGVSIDGAELDNGQHILLGAYGETLRLIRMTGGDESSLMLRLPLELVYPGEFSMRAPTWLPAPLHLLAGLLSAVGLAWRDKLAAVRFMLDLRRIGFVIDPDVSVSDLLTRYGQTARTRTFLWEPLCIAALNTAPELASARVFACVLRDAFTHARRDSDLLIPRTGLSALYPDLALRFIVERGGSVRLGTTVDALSISGDRISMEAEGELALYDAVVCALPPQRAATIFVGDTLAAQDLRSTLAAFEYESIVTCYLQYPTAVRLPRPMIGMAGAISQWAFDRGALGGPAGLIAVVVSAAGRLRGLPGDALAAAIDGELRTIVPGLPAPNRHRIINEKRATFRCLPDLRRPRIESPLAGVFLAGDHLFGDYPATLEAAVRSGVAAARAVLDRVATMQAAASSEEPSRCKLLFSAQPLAASETATAPPASIVA